MSSFNPLIWWWSPAVSPVCEWQSERGVGPGKPNQVHLCVLCPRAPVTLGPLPALAKSRSCLLLYDPVDCSPPGCSVHGTLQARILEWVAVPFSRGSSRPRDRTLISYISCLAGGLLPLGPPGKPLPAQAPTKHGSGREQSVVATLQLLNAISDVEKHVFLFAI